MRDLGVSEDDAAYSLDVHYMMQGQLSFIICFMHVKRIVNIQCDIVLVDLSDVSGVDLDGQVKNHLSLPVLNILFCASDSF